MDAKIAKAYRRALRELLEREGVPVLIIEDERKRWPSDPDMWVSTYGWKDDAAAQHIKTCPVTIPEGVDVVEVAYSEFADTMADNTVTVGINAMSGPTYSTSISCLCGKHQGLTLRHQDSLGNVLRSILGLDLKRFEL